MSKNLVIVESPAKAKTIKKYLGKDFSVMASYGHVRDLRPKKGAVDPDAGFLMHYEVIEKNAKHVDAIQKALKKADALYLATDPDREGEAISWHLIELLQERKALKNKSVHRVVFHEITKNAVKQAVENSRTIDMNLVNAQQARRALDYLVGFNLSPLLWKKVRRGLSAGRVQSPALRLIVEREEEIEAFESKEYWTITADCNFKKQMFDAKLIEYKGEKVEQFTIINKKQATSTKQTLLKAADGKLQVVKVDKRTRKRNPAAPFTTSTLQQEAARKLGFTTKRTMRIAQQLYEGMELDGEAHGLITYMRTDSVNLAQEAITEIRKTITEKYGEDNLPDQPKVYKTKSKNAQEAHEAIRPTSALRTPESIKNALSQDQYKLYSLIWKRTIASQMIHATLNTVAVDLLCGKNNRFRANGFTIVHPGFMAVYQEGYDDKKSKDKEDKDKILPPLAEGDIVKLKDILCDQHFTEPPPRYSEASLVKALEERGIGRPSTYASIISTLQYREYAILEQKRFYPTDVGRIVNKFLTKYFADYVDYDFTAKMEDKLDEISRGEAVWIPLLESFWSTFKDRVDHIDKTVQREDVTQEKLDEVCPECGKKLSIRLGRAGRFIGCTGFPECKYTRSLEGDEKAEQKEMKVVEGRTCPECGSPLHIKHGRYGKFIGCSGYPKCKHVESLEKPKDTKVTCPECNKGTILQRKSRRGKIFYSCSRYPDCKYAIWNEPINEKCPKCGWPILTIKVTKRRGKEKICPQKDCDYVKKIE
jgi:DNA topoisomerase-1